MGEIIRHIGDFPEILSQQVLAGRILVNREIGHRSDGDITTMRAESGELRTRNNETQTHT